MRKSQHTTQLAYDVAAKVVLWNTYNKEISFFLPFFLLFSVILSFNQLASLY